ncbi:MAG: hypothetical protein QW680_13710 [Pyrobaculum sp.]|jgi:hypothetical protein|uniref:hypothetical protein n=1 Tax=Pyrobaculum TaxID=2276 RepID=UPI00257C2656|nr:hypothetical protein [Pyrobaculum sp.]
MLAVYGACLDNPEVLCVESPEELRRWLGKAVIAVVGDEKLAGELQVAHFTGEEWEELVKYFRQAAERGYA